MLLQSDFSETAKYVITKYVRFLEEQKIEKNINIDSIIDEDKEIFCLGYELGFLVAELQNLFSKTYNRVMDQSEEREIRELVEVYAVPKLKLIILGI